MMLLKLMLIMLPKLMMLRLKVPLSLTMLPKTMEPAIAR